MVKFSTTEDRRHYRGSFDRRMFERTIERIERHYSWPRRFSNAITQKADDLDKYLVRFDNRLRNLQRFSDGYLSINHPDLYGKDPKYLREKGMRLLGESAKKEVLEARKDANALYRAYTAGDDLRCHLALATLQERRAKPASVPERDFQFLLSNDINTYEIVAHPINYPDTSARRRLPSTLADAFRAVSRDSQEPADLLPPKASKGHGFVLSIAERAKLSNIQRQQPLSMLIKAASINARDGFNYRDRIAVAGTLVEGCHRLLGTPWLDHLDSNNIRGLKARDQAWTAMLGFNNRGKQSVAETLSEMATGRAGVSIHHCQIFRLGLVLIEVALGALVSYIEISPDPWAPGVNVVIRDLGGDQKLPAMTIAAAVEKETSVLYGDMVFFCLSVLQSADKMRAPDLDLQYDEYIMKPYATLKKSRVSCC